jgi:hypothetical protein
MRLSHLLPGGARHGGQLDPHADPGKLGRVGVAVATCQGGTSDSLPLRGSGAVPENTENQIISGLLGGSLLEDNLLGKA